MGTKLKANFYNKKAKVLMCALATIFAIVAAVALIDTASFDAFFYPKGYIQEHSNITYNVAQKVAENVNAGADYMSGLESVENFEHYRFVTASSNDANVFNNTTYDSYYISNYHFDFYDEATGETNWTIVDVYMSADMYADMLSSMSYIRLEGFLRLVLVIISLMATLVFTVAFGVVSGQNAPGEPVTIRMYNRVYNDILTLVIGFVYIIIIATTGNIVTSSIFLPGYGMQMEHILLVTSVLALSALGLYYVNCLAKRKKRKELFRYTWIYVNLSKLKQLSTWLWDRLIAPTFNIRTKSLKYSILGMGFAMFFAGLIGSLFIGLFLGMIFNFPLVVFVPTVTYASAMSIVTAWLTLHTLRETEQIKEGVAQLRAGNSTYKIPPLHEPMLQEMAQDINNLGDGITAATQKAISSERMKSELITNVSHDLKTPLTAVISYVDLLSGVEDLPEEAWDYVAVLKKKSSALSDIVSDVFDLAKSNSGTADFNIEQLDYCRLIRQTLADMQDNIESSGLTFVNSLPEQEIFINSDGKRLYRCFQNLIDNSIKYSLPGTRVFVRLFTENGKATATILNTSATFIEFDNNEIKERFVRGDKSRTTQGNGLGLAIVDSFVSNCGGCFDIVLDGDSFKAIVTFPVVEVDKLKEIVQPVEE